MAEKKTPNPKKRTYGIYIAIGVVFLLILSAQSSRMQKAAQTDELTTSEFIVAVEEDRVEAVTYKASAGTLSGTYWETVEARDKGIGGASTTSEPTEVSDGGNIADEIRNQKGGDETAGSGAVEGSVSEKPVAGEPGSGESGAEESSTKGESPEAASDDTPHTLAELLGLEKEEEADTGSTRFTSTFVGTDALVELMAEHPETEFNVDVRANNVWLSILTSFVPILLLLGVFIFFMSQMSGMNGKQMQFGKTKAKKSPEERPDTKYSDVAGIDEALEELKEVSDFLSNPAKYQRLGAKIPRGVLLVGPPGCGKTLLAKAVAGEAGVPFFSISGSDFVEMFVGVGASRVRDLFEQAREAAPSIIFIDEIDAVGRQRGAGLGGGHDEREQTLNQLLVEMDGFDDHESVILMAATNRVDILDPALLRPGRFDRQITVQPPDLKGREQILQVHAKGKPFSKHVDMATVAKLTPGFSGADLANLTNEAALLTARRNKSIITMDEVNEAMERIIAGPERKGRIMTEAEKRTIAYHESGHALVGHLLEHADPVHKISIIARGQALGYTLSLPEEDRFLSTRSEMYDELAMFLGGRVAEEIACGDITTGASNDLERATKMAKQMVTRYGMTEALGSQVYGEANHNPFLGRDYSSTPDYSEATATKIDEEVARIMRHAHDVAHKILTENREQLDLMASVLLERETVEGEAVQALLDNKWDEYLEHESEILARKAEEQRLQEEEDARQLAEAQAAAQKAISPEDEYWQGARARAEAWETGASNPIRDAALGLLEDSPKDGPKPPIIDGVPADQLRVKEELEKARQQTPFGAEPIGDPTLQIPAQPEDMEWVEADETCTAELPEETENQADADGIQADDQVDGQADAQAGAQEETRDAGE